MNELSYIKQLPETKSEIKAFAEGIIQSVVNGDAPPIEVITLLKSLETTVKTIRDDARFKDALEDALDLWPEKTFEFMGVKYTKAFRANYDYSNTPQHVEMKTKLKEMEAVLKAIKEPVADVETGEMLYPAQKKGSESLTITLPK